MPASLQPVFGRFVAPPPAELARRLGRVSGALHGHAAFRAYLTTHAGATRYGLALPEVLPLLEQEMPSIRSLSLTAVSATRQVVRVLLRTDRPAALAQAQYVVATGQRQLDREIEGILLNSPPLPATPAPERTAHHPAAVCDLPPRPRHAPASARPRTYEQPVICLSDAFSFDTSLPAAALIDLLNHLSETYFAQAPFHLRVETSDGDYHLRVNRQELRYLFAYRRHVLHMVYADVVAVDGQSPGLRLSYHPLACGLNAGADIVAAQAQDLLDTLRERIGLTAPRLLLPDRVGGTFTFSLADFDLDRVLEHCEQLSRTWLHGIPPIAVLRTHDGRLHQGLSFYQLARIFDRAPHAMRDLCIGIWQPTTGQTFTLMLHLATGRGVWNLMWGDPAIHRAVAAAGLLAGSQATPGRPWPAASSTCLLVAQPGSTCWEALARSLAPHTQLLRIPEGLPHQVWGDSIVALLDAGQVVADLSYLHPDTRYLIDLARLLGRRVLLTVRADTSLPPGYQDLPTLRYTGDVAQAHAQTLAAWLHPTRS